MRRSGRSRPETLRTRAKALRRDLHAIGLRIVDQWLEVACGRELSAERMRFHAAIEDSSQRNLDLVTDHRNRFLRAENYNGRTDQPTPFQMLALKLAARGVRLLTLFPPDWNDRRVRASEINRSHKAGRPRKPIQAPPGTKKQRREKWKPEVQRLRAQGQSFRAIARALKLPLNTVHAWAKSGRPVFSEGRKR